MEYDGEVENPTETMLEVQKNLNALVAENLTTEKKDLTAEEAERIGFRAPAGKNVRIVNFI